MLEDEVCEVLPAMELPVVEDTDASLFEDGEVELDGILLVLEAPLNNDESTAAPRPEVPGIVPSNADLK